MSNDNLHPLIQGWIDGLNKGPDHIKQNYANTLRVAKEAIDEALLKYSQDVAAKAAFKGNRR